MNAAKIKGTWNVQKGKLKQRYAKITDNDYVFYEGIQNEKIGNLQLGLCRTKERLHKFITID